MGKNERTRKSRSQRPAKVRIKAMLKLAKVKAKNNMFSHTSELTQKRWGRLLSDGTKRIEVRAWSKTKLLNRLSSGSDPKVGRFTWSHEGHNTVTFMYPFDDERAAWGTASSFSELKADLTALGLYTKGFSTEDLDPQTPENLRGGQAEFEAFVQSKLRLADKDTTLAWFKVRVLHPDKRKGPQPKPPTSGTS